MFFTMGQREPEFVQEKLVIESTFLDKDKELTVYYPMNVNGPISTIYLLDGEWNFEVTQGILDLFIRWERIPENVALVSIPNEGTRTYDMTPVEDDMRFPGSGGGTAFLQFFESELIPFVEERLGRSSDRLLIGHSFGGLFALYALCEKPGLFDGIMAISPSTWYGGGYLMKETYKEKISRLANDSFLFISTGEFDGVNVASNKLYYNWVKEINPDLDLHYRLYEGRNHFTNVVSSTDEGLNAYYPGPEQETEIDSSYEEGGLELLKAWHENQKVRYGQRLITPTSSFLNLARKRYAAGEIQEAAQILYWVETLDNTNGNLYYLLGVFNRQLNDHEAATKYFNIALTKNLPKRTKIITERTLNSLK